MYNRTYVQYNHMCAHYCYVYLLLALKTADRLRLITRSSTE